MKLCNCEERDSSCAFCNFSCSYAGRQNGRPGFHRNGHFAHIGCPGRRERLEHPDEGIRHVFDATEICCGEPVEELLHSEIFRGSDQDAGKQHAADRNRGKRGKDGGEDVTHCEFPVIARGLFAVLRWGASGHRRLMLQMRKARQVLQNVQAK